LFAGKTESTKLLVQHVVHLCSQQTTNLHQRIIEVSIATFEAFYRMRSRSELTFTFAICGRPSICHPSICHLSTVTFVCPTQLVEVFGNVLRHFYSSAIHC